MNKLIIFFFIVACSFSLKAQQGNLSVLKSNAALFHETKVYQNNARLEYIDNNRIVNTNSMTLPFVDDFYRNTLKPYNFDELYINDTILYASGTCITNGDFDVFNKAFSNTQAYYYFYDTILDIVDSIMLPQVQVYNFSEATCFPTETSIANFWPAYYRSSLADFDIVTGEKLDSSLVVPDTTITLATIYFANLPDQFNWIDNFAWWNTTLPINPITIGVATLDGLNEYGLAYNKTVTNAYGEADVLTSRPIDLSLLGENDNVYLSFFYQAGGLGDFPNPEDSLSVQFKGLDGVWSTKWSIPGSTDDKFKQVYIPIYGNSFDSLIYSYPDFQFRFKNYASLSGNNDIWNIDYVRLDKNRQPNTLDSVVRDVALLYDFPSYLKTYSMLPWNQMQAGADSFADTIIIPIRDNGQVEGIQTGSFPLEINISNSINADIIYNESGTSFNPQLGQEIKNHEILPSTNFVLPSFASDSAYFNTSFAIAPINRNSRTANDTINNSLLFYNVMAYDDGSAERAYGMSGGGNEVKRFAYEYNVAEQDTLAAIQIHFSNIDVNVDDLVFSIFVWDSLEIGASEIDAEKYILGSIDNKKAVYIDNVNGFATFVFDTPIIVNDKFYVGWAQIDNRNLQIGYDLNSTKGRDKMFEFANNVWYPSSVSLAGSPMLRIILDGDFPIPDQETSIQNVSKIEYIKVYPNPTNSVLNIDIPESLSDYSISIIDFTGKQVYLGNEHQIDVSAFTKGMYLLSVIDNSSLKRYSSRFLVGSI
ncbi:MAG: T9SS type A sorting domain-containing protein [Chitinophagales bacterium]